MTHAATIIVPLKSQNDAWLNQCIRSAISQTAPCEVIVVRSKQTPPSNIQLLDNLQAESTSLRVLVEETAGSFPGALNLGIRSACADRIGFLLSDDWLEADAVAHCLPRTADIVSTGLTAYYEDGLTVFEQANQNLAMARYSKRETVESKAAYLQHLFIFRKQALLDVGGLDESIGNFPGIDDYDLIWTLLEHGATVDIVEKRLYNYRDHPGDRLTLADKEQAIRNLKKILRKHRVSDSEFEQLVERHARWFGRTMYEVLSEQGP